MLIVPDHVANEIKHQQKELASKFVKDRIEQIAKIYHDRMPDLDEFWILIAGKKDLYSNKINVSIQAFDKESKPDFPIQGGQMWHIVWSKGLKELEWILPLQKKIRVRGKKISDTDIENYSQNSLIVRKSLEKASKVLGRNFLTGKRI